MSFGVVIKIVFCCNSMFLWFPLEKRLFFSVKIFWPNRSKAKGFSIQNFAFKNNEKSSTLPPNKISDQFLSERNLKSINEESQPIKTSHLYIKRGHWANRDFSEYKNVA